MSSTLLNIHACFVSETDDGLPAFTHRARHAVDLLNTLESFLLGLAFISDPATQRSVPGLLLWYVNSEVFYI